MQATVIVPDDQLSLAIGKEGQNARLAARLTGWRVDIRSETEFAEDESAEGYEEEEVAGRCCGDHVDRQAVPERSARPARATAACPAHQALADKEGDEVEPAAPVADAAATERRTRARTRSSRDRRDDQAPASLEPDGRGGGPDPDPAADGGPGRSGARRPAPARPDQAS